MSIQAELNAEALSYLPEILNAIRNAEAFEANQMQNITLQRLLSSDVAVDHMDATDLAFFQADLLDYFKYQEWM